MSTHVVVIAGGAGTRFWPAGRVARPKQLLPIAGDRTMLAATLDRCAALAPPAQTYVVTNQLQAEATRAECPQLAPDHVVAEPMMRNTAAAIGLAAGLIARQDPGGVMVVMPADHVIRPIDVFESTFRAAIARAEEAEVLLTIGIRPTGPATGYGYIEGGAKVKEIDGHAVHRVTSFKEKPDAATAVAFVKSQRYYWNSGTFVWRVATLLEALRLHLPAHHETVDRIVAAIDAGGDIPAEEYARFENVPIDIGVMEKAGNVEVIPAEFEWDDVGSWLAVDRLGRRDEEGNVRRGETLCLDTSNCIVLGDADHLVATIGLHDLIVVHTADATLICPKERSEEVRRIVSELKEKDKDRWL